MASFKNKEIGINKWGKITVAAVLLLLLAVGAFWAFHLTNSDATNVATPLEKSLLAQGAVKVCGSGSSGHGPDDLTPIHTAYYETTLDRDEASALIAKVASENGFNLKHAQDDDLPVPAIYINNWYFDYSSKTSQLPWAEKGPVKLTFVLGNASTTTDDSAYTVVRCGDKKNVTIKNDKDNIAIQLRIELPPNKW
jgi:hypothetical protein